MRDGLGSKRVNTSAIGLTKGTTRAQPITRLTRVPIGSRRLAGLSLWLPSISGLIALPRFAPRIRAIAAAGVTNPEYASDITSRTTVTLEWAAQVSAAAPRRQRMGSRVVAASKVRTAGAVSA